MTTIEKAAIEHATLGYIGMDGQLKDGGLNPTKQTSFIRGATWALEEVLREVEKQCAGESGEAGYALGGVKEIIEKLRG